jgi:mono/diheme cytochrome c family protein
MKILYPILAVVLLVITVVAIAGFRGDHFQKPPFEVFPDMIYQAKVKDQVPNPFFADGVGNRTPVPGTVAEEMPTQNDYWSTGKWDETHWGNGIPVHEARLGLSALQIDAANMERGRERFNISCAVCHGAAGDGQGVAAKLGVNSVANYHSDAIIQRSDGDIFNTITNGKGQMIGLGYNISIDDRWRIIMYVRTLQRMQKAAWDDLTPEQQQALLDKQAKKQ